MFMPLKPVNLIRADKIVGEININKRTELEILCFVPIFSNERAFVLLTRKAISREITSESV